MQPMKISAIAVIVIGLLIAGFAVMAGLPTPTTPQTPEPIGPSAFPIAAVLFPFAIIAISAGAAMWIFGGRGSVKTRNPAVRN